MATRLLTGGGGGVLLAISEIQHTRLPDWPVEPKLRDGRATFSHNIIFLKYAEPGGAELSHGGALAPLKIG